MKQTLRQSIYSLFSGECRSSCKGISVNPKLTLFVEKCHINRPLVGGFKSIQRPLCSSSDEVDDFSELGPTVDELAESGSPAVQSAGAPLKLLTEKPENFKRNNRYSPSESSPIFKNILSGLSKSKAFPASSPKVDLDEHDNVSGCGANSKKASNMKISSYIRIENVPYTVTLPQLIEAISKYGNTASASMRSLRNGIICCYVKFEDEESSRKAISAGEITVGMCRLPISPVSVTKPVTFRIKSIRKDTEDSKIQSICNSFGELESLQRVNKNVAHAIFTLKDESETQSILTKLNSTVIEGCRWLAELQLPTMSEEIESIEEEDEYDELKLKMSNVLYELRKEASLNRIYAEDIQHLHSSIMVIEDQFSTSSYS